MKLRLRSSVLLTVLLPVLSPSLLVAQSQTAPTDPAAVNVHLEIGPIDGLTTTWHPAPVLTAAPLGAHLFFRVRVPSATTVRWVGAQEVPGASGHSTATVELLETGAHTVAVEFETLSGEPVAERIELDVIDVPPGSLRVDAVQLAVDEVTIDESRLNASTVEYFFRSDSIAVLREVEEGRYRTSVNRWITLQADADPPGFTPLVEWRLDGAPQKHLGSGVRLRVYPVGLHRIAAGPAASAAEVALETYQVKIVQPRPGTRIRDALPTTFRAVTDPAGLESEVRWLAAAKFGTPTPVTGQGPEFTVRFDGSFGDQDPFTGEFGQWIGVRADNAIYDQDRSDPSPADGDLEIDPDWAFDPETEFPDRLPPAPPSDAPVCVPGLEAALADVDGDGQEEIVKLTPRSHASGPCIDEVAYCVERPGLCSGDTVFQRVGGSVLSPDLPIPLAAISDGCQGAPAAVACPVLSNGERALFCEALPPDAACQTITVCPDSGAWPDPSDPSVRDVFQAKDSDEPTPDLQVPADEQLEAAELILINPCTWGTLPADPCSAAAEQPSHGASFCKSLDPLPNPGACSEDHKCNGKKCETSSDCRSGRCEEGFCTSDHFLNLFRGSDDWNVHFAAGIQELSAKGSVRFYPSMKFDVRSQASVDLEVTLFGHAVDLFSAEAKNETSECGYAVSFDAQVLGASVDLSQRLQLGPENVFVELEADKIEEGTDPAKRAECEALVGGLRDLEKEVNEKLHNALVAAYFWNEAGGVGAEIHTKANAESYVGKYEEAAGRYQAKLADLRAVQSATDHSFSARPADLEIELVATVPRELTSVSIGPFTLGIEASVVGKLGVAADLVNTRASDLANLKVQALAGVIPRASVGAHVFFYGGIGGGPASAQAGIRGVFDLAVLQVPMTAEFDLTQDVQSFALPALPPEFSDTVSGFLVQPSAATLNLPFSYGARLEGDFLSGRLDAVVRARLLFASKEWKKTLVSWPGFARSWQIGLPAAEESLLPPLTGQTDLGAVPDMVQLLALVLADVPEERSAAEVQADLKRSLGDGHEEADLEKPWRIPSSGSTGQIPGKCPKP